MFSLRITASDTTKVSGQMGILGEAAQGTAVLRTNTWLVFAASEPKEGLLTAEGIDMTKDAVPMVVYIHTFYCPNRKIHKLQGSESRFPHENIDKNTDTRAVFPTNHVKIFLSNSGDFFFPTLTTLECSFVFVLSTHVGLSIPVQPPLSCILKGEKRSCASSNHHPKCYKALDNTGNTLACAF